MRIWDALSFLFVLSVLGSFSFWVLGYFALETVRFILHGPSRQLASVGTSIINEPEMLRLHTVPPGVGNGMIPDDGLSSVPGRAA